MAKVLCASRAGPITQKIDEFEKWGEALQKALATAHNSFFLQILEPAKLVRNGEAPKEIPSRPSAGGDIKCNSGQLSMH